MIWWHTIKITFSSKSQVRQPSVCLSLSRIIRLGWLSGTLRVCGFSRLWTPATMGGRSGLFLRVWSEKTGVTTVEGTMTNPFCLRSAAINFGSSLNDAHQLGSKRHQREYSVENASRENQVTETSWRVDDSTCLIIRDHKTQHLHQKNLLHSILLSVGSSICLLLHSQISTLT